MAYITGTMSDANPGAALYALIAPVLTSTGYTLVDTVVISTRTHKIWKSAAANNTVGKDWYLDFTYPTTGAGDVSLQPMEFFDPATDTVLRAVHGTATTIIDPTTYSRFGATAYTLESVNLVLNASVTTGLTLATSTSTFGYWVSVTGNRIVVLGSAAPSTMVYAGMFLPDAGHQSVAGAAMYPLIVAKLIPSGASSSSVLTSNTVAVTRAPVLTSIAWSQHLSIQPEFHARGSTIPLSNFTNNARTASRFIVASEQPPWGVYGFLDGVATIVSSGVARGDTVTIAGETWVCATTTSSGSVILKAS